MAGCGGLRWIAVDCSGLHWFTVVYSGLHLPLPGLKPRPAEISRKVLMDIKRLKNGYKKMTGTGKEVLRFLEMKSWSENVRREFETVYISVR